MSFSREELRELSNPKSANQDRVSQVGAELLKKISDDCENVTIAEKLWICKMLQLLHKGNVRLDPFDFPCCEDVLFQIRYILYFNNVEGWYPSFDWNGQILDGSKKRDLILLQKCFQEWSSIIQRTNHTSPLLQNVSTETRHHLKLIERYCKRASLGSNRMNYLKKSLTLHSKYMFGLVEEYYQENPERQYFQIDGRSAFVDSFFFIHTIFRHYGQVLKEYQVGKSYHEEGLDYKNLPLEILKILEAYSKISNGEFDGQKVYFEYNEKIFAIWFRLIRTNVSKGVFLEELKIQTLYPVESVSEVEKISRNYSQRIESEGYHFFF